MYRSLINRPNSHPFAHLFRAFDDFFGEYPLSDSPHRAAPPVTVDENEDGYTLTADMPDISADDIEVEIENGRVRIRTVDSNASEHAEGIAEDDAESNTTEEADSTEESSEIALSKDTDSDDVQILRREFHLRHYDFTYSLGDALDADRATATVDDGVLIVSVPRSESAKPRQIEVVAGDPQLEAE